MKTHNMQVFMLFYAIAWGFVSNVQGRWKAFQLPLVHRVRRVLHRALLSFCCFNILPFCFFVYALAVFTHRGDLRSTSIIGQAAELIVSAMLPSLAVFGFYRLWLGIIELIPTWFYHLDSKELLPEFQHVEPTVRLDPSAASTGLPVIDIGPHTGVPNVVWAIVYIVMGGITVWIRF